MARATRVLAAEYDEGAAAALADALVERRARRLWRFAGMGGSQEVEICWYLVKGRMVRTERETFFGLKVIGPAALVDALTAAVHAKLNPPAV